MPSDPEDRNVLGIPEVLRSAVDGPTADVLGVILVYIDGLPSEMKEEFENHFEPERLQELRELHNGLLKIRRGTMPSYQELEVIASPHELLRDLAEGIEETALSSRIPLELITFVDSNIVEPLKSLVDSFLPDPADGIVKLWLLDRDDTDRGPHYPGPAEPHEP